MKAILAVLFALLFAVPAMAQEQAIHGYVNYAVHEENRIYMTADDGRPIIVDISQSPGSPNHRKAGEAVMVYGQSTGPNSFRATNVIADRDRAQSTAAPTGWASLQGKVDRVDGSRLQLRTADSRVITVDMSQVAAAVRQAVQAGDTITVIGEANAQTPQLFTAKFVQSDRTATAIAQATGATATPTGGWQRLHGQVQTVTGSTMTFRADDGRTLTVDMAQVSPNVQRALTPNEGVEVIGHMASGDPNRVVARWIQQDSSNPDRGGRIAGRSTPPPAAAPAPAQPAPAAAPPKPGAKVDEKAWQRIHGKVESVSGARMRLKADDGRSIEVGMAKVSANVQKALTVGESVTVIGHYDGDRRHVEAQFIQQERAGGAASPKTDPKKK